MKVRFAGGDSIGSPHMLKVFLVAEDGSEFECKTLTQVIVDARAGIELRMWVGELDGEVSFAPRSNEHADALISEIAKLTAERDALKVDAEKWRKTYLELIA